MKTSGQISEWWKKQTEKFGRPWGILLIIGLLLAVVAWPARGKDSKTDENAVVQSKDPAGQATESLTYEEQLEEKLERALSGVKGAGKVKVMITLESSPELVLQIDESGSSDTVFEEDSSGGKRESRQSDYSKDTVRAGSDDTPYVIKEINPKVSGVLVIAQGAGKASVKNEIYEAVEALFSVPVHKIKVLEGE